MYVNTTGRYRTIGTNLPREEAPLRVRHDGQVPAVLGAQAGDAVGRAVGVERVGLGRAVGVVHEPVHPCRVGRVAMFVHIYSGKFNPHRKA